MIKGFPIDFVRQAFEQTLLQEHIKNVNYFGGKDQVCIFSLYEQLLKGENVDRYVETFRDLTEQQNRSGLILNGVLSSPENPTITNLYSCMIIPMTFTCAMQCKVENRDQALETVNNMIEELKGAKVDIAQLKCRAENGDIAYVPFMVGTIGHNDGEPFVKNGDFIGVVEGESTYGIETLLNQLAEKGVYDTHYMFTEGEWYYVENDGKLKVVYCDGDNYLYIVDDGREEFADIIFPPEHESFGRFKLSLSFEAMRCDTPFNLNSDEIVVISFGGSATLVNESVSLGNDLIKIGIKKDKIITKNGSINYLSATRFYLEPLEMPSGNNANTKINQLVSNKFMNNSHTDALSLTLQYTFIADMSQDILKQWFKYGRYGTQHIDDDNVGTNTMTPNLIYDTIEYWSSWGNFEREQFLTKLVESIDIDNTESDTLTIGVTMQIQGENN